MAPVFLAVTNDADDNVCDLQRKCKSIEDLCSVINQEMTDLEGMIKCFVLSSSRRRIKYSGKISIK